MSIYLVGYGFNQRPLLRSWFNRGDFFQTFHFLKQWCLQGKFEERERQKPLKVCCVSIHHVLQEKRTTEKEVHLVIDAEENVLTDYRVG